MYQSRETQLCVQLTTSADDVTLFAFAAELRAAVRRGAGRPAAAGPTAANPPHAAAAADRWDRQTDKQTDAVPLHRPCSIPCEQC